MTNSKESFLEVKTPTNNWKRRITQRIMELTSAHPELTMFDVCEEVFDGDCSLKNLRLASRILEGKRGQEKIQQNTKPQSTDSRKSELQEIRVNAHGACYIFKDGKKIKLKPLSFQIVDFFIQDQNIYPDEIAKALGEREWVVNRCLNLGTSRAIINRLNLRKNPRKPV